MENLRLEVDSIDILVSAAGGVCGQTGKPITEVSERDWREIFAANLDSVFSHAAYRTDDGCERLGQNCNY